MCRSIAEVLRLVISAIYPTIRVRLRCFENHAQATAKSLPFLGLGVEIGAIAEDVIIEDVYEGFKIVAKLMSPCGRPDL